jgi:hypothetical protein
MMMIMMMRALKSTATMRKAIVVVLAAAAAVAAAVGRVVAAPQGGEYRGSRYVLEGGREGGRKEGRNGYMRCSAFSLRVALLLGYRSSHLSARFLSP